MRIPVSWSCLLLLVIQSACSCGNDDSEAILGPRTKVVDAQTHALLEEITSEGDLRFSGTSPLLQEMQVGDVLVFSVGAGTPNGALRKVLGIQAQGAGLRLSSQQARLQDAFERLHLTAADTLSPEDATGVQQRQAGSGFSFPFQLDSGPGAGRAQLAGSLALEPRLDFELELDIAKFELDELSLTFGAAETFEARLTGQGSVNVNKELRVATVPFTPIILTIPTPAGAVPVVLTPQMAVEVGMSGTTSGGFTASVLQQASVEARVGYVNGSFGGTAQHEDHYTADTPSAQANLALRAFGGPRFEILLYGAVGPWARVEGGLDLTATAGGPPLCLDWALNGAVRARAGIDFIAEVETELFSASEELEAWDGCGGDPNNPAPLPPSTWARSYGRAGSLGDAARAIAEVSSGGYVVAGDSTLFGGVTGNNVSSWVLRLDPEGNVVWQRAYGGFTTGGSVKAVAEVPGGFVVVTGLSLLKLDLAGNPLWARRYGVDLAEALEFRSLEALPDGSVVVAGSGGPLGAQNGWAMRVDAEGTVLWSRRFGGERVHSVRALSNGEVLLVGSADNATTNAWLVRLDTSGNVVWARAVSQQYDDNGDEPGGVFLDAIGEGLDAVETASGLEFVGWSYGGFKLPQTSAGGFFAAWTVDLTPDGEVVRGTVYRARAETELTRLYAAAPRTGSAPLFVGEVLEKVGTDERDILLVQGGTARILSTPGEDFAYFPDADGGGRPLVATRDGGFVMAVTTTGLAGQQQVWVLKLGRTADVPLTGNASLSAAPGFWFQNPNTISSAAAALAPVDLSVSSTDITAQVSAESTALVEARQSR
ncbi:MAG: hypothetical protein WBV82_04380 [Myxococcaceae bacterium]